MEIMMHRISFILALFFTTSIQAGQEVDSSCLNHLGGAFIGVECYNSLAIEMESKNKLLEKAILLKMSAENTDRVFFKKYILVARQSESFCRLQKNAYANWNFEKKANGARYYDYDVIYFECVYNKRIENNKFLAQLFEYINQ